MVERLRARAGMVSLTALVASSACGALGAPGGVSRVAPHARQARCCDLSGGWRACRYPSVSAVKGRMLRYMADATDQQISINAATLVNPLPVLLRQSASA
jgi:hypothetical protein